MSISLYKIIPQYNGYIANGDSSKSVVRTLYSFFNRYPEQTSEIKKKFQNSTQKTKMLIIGVSQGQEPLTHIQSAYEVAQMKKEKIEDVLDLSLIEASEQIPIFEKAEKYANKDSIEFLKKLYKDTSKAHFSTPFETIVSDMRKKNLKQDIILFNNVIQHLNYGENGENEKSIINSIDELIDMVNTGGLFCFTCEPLVLHNYKHINNSYNKVCNMLSKKGFIQIEKGIYKKTNYKTITQAQKAQALYTYK